MWLSTLKVEAAQFLSAVTEIARPQPFLCMNGSPIRYGFRGSVKAIRYAVNTALIVLLFVIQLKG